MLSPPGDLLEEPQQEERNGALCVAVREKSERLVPIFLQEGQIRYPSYGGCCGKDCLERMDGYECTMAYHVKDGKAPAVSADLSAAPQIIAAAEIRPVRDDAVTLPGSAHRLQRTPNAAVLPASGRRCIMLLMDDPLLEEEKRIRRLRLLVNLAQGVLMQADLSLREAFAILRSTRKAALALFPDKGEVYDLIYTPRLMRIIRERFVVPGSM